MNYDAQRNSTTSDPVVEIGWKILMALLIILGAPTIVIGLIGSRLILERVPLEYHRLVWGLLIVIGSVCMYIGYRLYFPLNAPGSPFLLLMTDFGHSIHNGF